MKIISFVGRHNSGKTTLLTKLIPIFKANKINVALFKHTSHNIITTANNDSDNLFNAGADIVFLASPKSSIRYIRYEEEPSVYELVDLLPKNIDIVITEGYKKEKIPKIEVMRYEIDKDPIQGIENVIARVADFELTSQLPVFSFNDTPTIYNFIINYLDL